MIFEKFVLSLSLYIIYVKSGRADCPGSGLVTGCRCEDNNIYCGGTKTLDLLKLFEGLSQTLHKSEKHFQLFYLNNKAISSLESNAFKDLVFDEIQIESSTNLTKISENAFNGTDSVTKKLRLASNPKLENSNNSLFNALKKFKTLNSLQISYNNISGIPDNAFASSFLNQLRSLEFTGTKIKTLGQNAFRSLDSLTLLSISETGIGGVPDNAFAFDKESNNTLTIQLISNSAMNGSSFALNSLNATQRPVVLEFGSRDKGSTPYQMTFLQEKVFLKFLNQNKKNRIDLKGQSFDCNDCRSYWLIKQSKLLEQIKNLECSNNKPFNDSANFAKCRD